MANLSPVKLPEQAIAEIKELQQIANKLLSDPKNIDIFDETFPIFKNDTMTVTIAILDFIDNHKNKKNKKKRRKKDISLIKRVRQKKWIDGDVRGYNTE